MRTINIRLVSFILLATMFTATFAFADNDREEKSEHRRKNKQSFMLSFPFSDVGTTTVALEEQIKSLHKILADLKAQRGALHDSDDDRRTSSTSMMRDNDDRQASSTRIMRKTLKMQIKETKRELKDARKEKRRELKFARSLARGMSGDDVRNLQELLAQDSPILSANFITGFFDRNTEEALRKFQKKSGIESIGVFGPKTQVKLLTLFVGRELPPGIIRRLGLETSTTTPGHGFVTLCHLTGNTGIKQTLVVAVPALGVHLAHGDTVGVCPGSGTATTTPPVDKTAPIISAISVSSIASTSAQVNWTTNEAAASKTWYGTSALLTLGGSTLNVVSGTLVTSHIQNLTGLSASTTYQYVVETRDAALNTATSSQQSFTTAN